MTQLRWGILATGNIAARFAKALHDVEDAELAAVASRKRSSADAFGDKWSVPRRYASYEELAEDLNIDIIYIATPHSLHYENILSCLNAGKHVLCEKPLTINARQAEDCISLARQKGLFLMEAVWMRFFPAITQVSRWVADGTIGEVSFLQADFFIDVPYHPEHRLYNPGLGGGALLDLGIYPISLATMLLGNPQEVYGHAQLGKTTVDEINTITLVHKNNAISQLASSMRVSKPSEAYIVGSKGSIKIHDRFFSPDQLTLHVDGKKAQKISLPFLGNGYIHEIEEVHSCLRADMQESAIMSMDETFRTMQLLDDLRRKWGVIYPQELPLQGTYQPMA